MTINSKFHLKRKKHGYDLVYYDPETEVKAVLGILPTEPHEYNRKLLLVKKLINIDIMNDTKNSYIMREF